MKMIQKDSYNLFMKRVSCIKAVKLSAEDTIKNDPMR